MIYKAILADIDGTLIENGNISSVHAELQTLIQQFRSTGVLFSLCSGRALAEQRLFYGLLLGENKPHETEAILYESSSIYFPQSRQSHQCGGLTKSQMSAVQKFIVEKNLLDGLVEQENSETYQTSLGYVTPSFFAHSPGDRVLLTQVFLRVKPILEKEFSFLRVVQSADAIDILAKGIHKGLVVEAYSRRTGIALSQMVVIGDSGNDLEMFEIVGKAGGMVAYVGNDIEQEKFVQKFHNAYIPQKRGVEGTINVLKFIFNGGINNGK
ncbi:HAD family phosphatase [Candidatus Woesearchaeota archaeon]|nr:HAD family phosphatase [Candidatus Woesearchaeota archaeon]